MPGMDAVTGRPLGGVAHLRQSIRDVLTTPVGSRVGRREYGSRLPELVDRPMNAALLAEVYAATAEALGRWEPRFRLLSVSAEAAGPDGRLVLTLTGVRAPDGARLVLAGVRT